MGNACESNALWFVFRGWYIPHTPPYNSLRRSPVYIFYRSMGFSSAGNVLPVFRPMGWTFSKGKGSVTPPSRVGFTPSQFTPQCFFAGRKGRLCLLYCWWWWWKDEIRRGKTTERMYKNLPKNERFTISTGVVYFFHQQYVMFKAIRKLYIKYIKALKSWRPPILWHFQEFWTRRAPAVP